MSALISKVRLLFFYFFFLGGGGGLHFVDCIDLICFQSRGGLQLDICNYLG